MTLVNMGHMATKLGDYTRAQRLIADALEIHRRIGQGWALAKTLANQGELYIQLGQLKQAQCIFSESKAICEQIRAEDVLAFVKCNLAVVALAQGDDAQATTWLCEALKVRHEEGGPRYIIEVLEFMVQLALWQNQPERALRLVGAIAAQRKQYKLLAAPVVRAALMQAQADACQKLGDDAAAAAALSAGAAMTLDEVVAFALEVVS
jgi:tetratricopeptide (TPR) repeat protein